MPPLSIATAVAALAALASCTPAVAIHAPDTAAHDADRRWVLTEPALAGTPHVATAGDDIYLLACARAATLSRIVDGKPVWTRQLAPTCYALPDQAVPIAASRLGVIAAASFADGKRTGIRVAAFDRDGRPRWQTELVGGLAQVALAASPDRFAICAQNRGDATLDGAPLGEPTAPAAAASEYDAAGTRVAHVETSDAYPAAACSFDGTGALWTVRGWESATRPFHIGTHDRPLAPGTWAIRLAPEPRFVPLGHAPVALVTALPDGFVTASSQTSELAFVDLDGARRWRLVGAPHGCTLYPRPIAATATRALLAVTYLCEEPHGTAELADVTIEDREDVGDWEPTLRTVIVDLDTVAMHARTIHPLAGAPYSLRYVEMPGGGSLLAYGAFAGALGLGTAIHSTEEYSCNSDLPEDAQTWDSYEDTDGGSCRDGYHRVSRARTWPVVAMLSL